MASKPGAEWSLIQCSAAEFIRKHHQQGERRQGSRPNYYSQPRKKRRGEACCRKEKAAKAAGQSAGACVHLPLRGAILKMDSDAAHTARPWQSIHNEMSMVMEMSVQFSWHLLTAVTNKEAAN